MTTAIGYKPIYRMSGVGACPKALSAERMKIPAEAPPVWLATAAEEGRRHEVWMKEQLAQEGYEVEECLECPICKSRYGVKREGIHVELEYPTFILLGHLDARLRKNGDVRGGELKSASQFEFDRWMRDGFEGFPTYSGQITCYMEADKHDEWVYWVKNRSSGYIDKKILTTPPLSIEDIITKVAMVEEYVQAGELHPAEFVSESIECKRCEYKHLCVPEVKELSPVEQSDLESAVAEWRKGEGLRKRGEELIKIAKESFMMHTKATGIDKWKFADLVIHLIQVKEGVTYPKEKLLDCFTEEQLKPASAIKLPYEFIKVTDLHKEEENGNGSR